MNFFYLAHRAFSGKQCWTLHLKVLDLKHPYTHDARGVSWVLSWGFLDSNLSTMIQAKGGPSVMNMFPFVWVVTFLPDRVK